MLTTEANTGRSTKKARQVHTQLMAAAATSFMLRLLSIHLHTGANCHEP
jgi:hypothetical protein